MSDLTKEYNELLEAMEAGLSAVNELEGLKRLAEGMACQKES